MTDREQQQMQPDDLDAYLERYTPADLEELAAASFAIDLAMVFQHARTERDLSQATVAERMGMSQQAVSRIEQPNQNVTLETMRKYMSALNYRLEIVVREPESGREVERVVLDSVAPTARRRAAASPA